MDLIAFDPDRLYVGLSLEYTLRDKSGQLLLAKGHRITSNQQLAGIQSRKPIFMEVDSTAEGMRAIMSSLNKLNGMDAPIKDYAKYLGEHEAPVDDEKLSGTILHRWGDM
ncbi:MAG: hypothetical protein Fur007_22280 [Rhodoferax sp.]